MKVISVTCAIIEKDNKILCAQRSDKMNLPLKWEFPGGKVEDQEQFEDCLKREIIEELGVEVEILERLPSNKHQYSEKKTINLIPFRCSLQTFEIDLKEHSKIEWATIHDLREMTRTLQLRRSYRKFRISLSNRSKKPGLAPGFCF